MKTTKFKIQRDALADARQKTLNLMLQLRLIMKEVVNYNHDDFYAFTSLNMYYFWLGQYLLEIEKILELEGNTFLITKDTMQKINEYKNSTYQAEKLFTSVSNFSLSIH